MEDLFRCSRYKPLLAIFCAFGWSLAYPLIKIGYQEFQISSADLGGKILFAGIRFLFAGLLVSGFCCLRKQKLELDNKRDIGWLILLAIVNIALHYMFAYIGLGYNQSARSTILDSMGGFFLIILSTMIFSDDHMSTAKLLGCVLGILGIIAMNIQPGVDFFENITFKGDGMILLNAGCGAFGGVITRVTSKKMNMMKATGQSMMIGGAFLLTIGMVIGTEQSWRVTLKGVLVLFALMMISAVCYAIYNELLAYHPISKVAIYNALIPVLGVIFSALLLKEALKWQYFIAVMMVACGIYLVNSRRDVS